MSVRGISPSLFPNLYLQQLKAFIIKIFTSLVEFTPRYFFETDVNVSVSIVSFSVRFLLVYKKYDNKNSVLLLAQKQTRKIQGTDLRTQI